VFNVFHIYGFVICTLKLMVNGAKILTVPRFHPETFIDIIKNYPLSLVFAAPPLSRYTKTVFYAKVTLLIF